MINKFGKGIALIVLGCSTIFAGIVEIPIMSDAGKPLAWYTKFGNWFKNAIAIFLADDSV